VARDRVRLGGGACAGAAGVAGEGAVALEVGAAAAGDAALALLLDLSTAITAVPCVSEALATVTWEGTDALAARRRFMYAVLREVDSSMLTSRARKACLALPGPRYPG
jgi:hypothetical protein